MGKVARALCNRAITFFAGEAAATPSPLPASASS